MRILVDEEHLGWNKAWNIVCQIFSFTTHTVVADGLEKIPVDLLGSLLPRHLQVYSVRHMLSIFYVAFYPRYVFSTIKWMAENRYVQSFTIAWNHFSIRCTCFSMLSHKLKNPEWNADEPECLLPFFVIKVFFLIFLLHCNYLLRILIAFSDFIWNKF